VRVYLVRHAEAEPGEPDELRRLSPEGKRQARELGEQLRGEGLKPNAILTSPLLRARETGDELAMALGRNPETDERLAPGATVDGLRAAVSERGENVVAIGHQPDLGEIVAALTGEPEPRLPAGGLVVVDLD
jgi:phosphohistidine phosphatase